jgi:hypothetical protein
MYAQEEVKKDVEKKAPCCKVKADAKDKAAAKYEHKTMYVCPVKGCTYHSDKPGKCPTCDKELVKKEVCCPGAKHAKEAYYVCPMKECNYKTDKMGKCPKCGMELKKVVPAGCSAACAKACAHAKKEKLHKEHEQKDHKKDHKHEKKN